MEEKNPEAPLSLCVRPLVCMRPQIPPHSHAAIAPGLLCMGARGFCG